VAIFKNSKDVKIQHLEKQVFLGSGLRAGEFQEKPRDNTDPSSSLIFGIAVNVLAHFCWYNGIPQVR
jgi:hypothetical protein